MKRIVITAIVATMILSMSVLGQPNLITNGDFEWGNTDFTSEYTPVTSPGHNTLGPPGTYALGISPYNYHSSWVDYPDHTPSGPGNMLIVNAATDTDNPGVTVVWEQTVAVVPGANYVLTYWLSSSYPTNLAVIECSINGVALVPTATAPATTGVWQEVSCSWNSGSSTSAVIELEDLTRAYSGDDFAIDDICFYALNNPPVAVCQDVVVAAGADGYAGASIDGGSYDPDGDTLTYEQDPRHCPDLS